MAEETSELAERGEEIFERVVEPQLRQQSEEDDRKYIAIDVESEDFEVDANQSAAAKRLLERHPDADGQIWFRRVGSHITHHFGGRLQWAESERTLAFSPPTGSPHWHWRSVDRKAAAPWKRSSTPATMAD